MSLTKCPKGHKLPHQGSKGQCTPVYCADEGKRTKAPKKERATATEVALAKLPPQEQLDGAARAEADAKIAIRKSQAEAWAELVPVPKDLKGAEAEKWADEKLTELLPVAVADLERDLKYGSDEQRAKARDKVLDATGRGKTERTPGGNQLIIIGNMPTGANGMIQVPWAQRTDAPKGENK